MRREPLDILIVDDQAGVRYLLDILVREAGHRAHTAQNGLEAVELARTVRPDLVFMDVRMPLMGGLEALGKIKALIPETDVIIMTAFGSEETISQAMQEGALCCIAKPFDVDEIKEILAEYRWRRANSGIAAAGCYTF
ncbi:MAG: response regulator [Peptococcaceae bacterium]|nr:response regulator [Peptococcaceae bacterium]